MTERAFRPSSICLSDPQRRDEAVAQRAQNNVKKGGPFWDPSIESERAHKPWGAHPGLPWLTLAHLAREVRVFKAAWCGVGGGLFLIALPRVSLQNCQAPENNCFACSD